MSGVGVAGVPARTLTYPVPNVPPFGIYQLALPEWQDYAYDSLIAAQQPVRVLVDGLNLPNGSGERFGINVDYALTYVERRDTKDRNDLNDIELDRVIERVGNLVAGHEMIAVPITELGWMGAHIIAPFDQDTYEYQQLLNQQWDIERILHEAGMVEPPVNRPHHTSVSGFQFKFEQIPLHTRIKGSSRKEILDLLSKRLTAAGIDSVELGDVIVGKNYTTPFAPESWLTDACVEVVSYGEV